MSVRSKFHSLLKAVNFGDSIRGDIVAEILANHAHELAEKIRGHDVEAVSDDAKEIFGRAADLIDPEAA